MLHKIKKRGSITWETIVKLIIILVVFAILIGMALFFKERIYDLFNAFKETMGYRR